mmetsp:Transcript_107475/g.302454  ORF Transcript_107475/g.302454 Transcript_107475/m.302454 type:complete len:450 (+) Transcript_107475:76-1425(+)
MGLSWLGCTGRGTEGGSHQHELPGVSLDTGLGGAGRLWRRWVAAGCRCAGKRRAIARTRASAAVAVFLPLLLAGSSRINTVTGSYRPKGTRSCGDASAAQAAAELVIVSRRDAAFAFLPGLAFVPAALESESALGHRRHMASSLAAALVGGGVGSTAGPVARAGAMATGGWRRVPAAMADVEAAVETPNRFRREMDDREITQILADVHGWRRVDMGADGNCLFLSIAPQVAATDLAELAGRSEAFAEALGPELIGRWETLAATERASLLRRIAILDEREFFQRLATLHRDGSASPPEDDWRTLELYKDMAEEFMSSGYSELADGVASWNLPGIYKRVRALARETPSDEVRAFVLKHMEEYLRRTGTEGNWAGSSEMAALSHALQRPVQAYGNNWVSQDAIELEEDSGRSAEVLPYFAAPPGSETQRAVVGTRPIRVFQTRGGGHYQMLG